MLVVPQMIHLFSSSLSDPDKAWMAATTWRIFYGVSMGGYPYDKLLKPFVFVVLLAGFYLIWRRDRDTAVLLFLFTAGGMILAGLIGIYEPIYLVRTIQVYTIFSALFAAVAVVALPRMLGVLVGVALIVVNCVTVIERNYPPARQVLPAEAIAPLVTLLDAEEDRVFVKSFLRQQMLLLRVPLFDIATELNPDSLDAGIADAETAARCLGPGAPDPCRSVVIVIEKESRFGVEAIAAWNAMADGLKQRYPSHSEHLLSGYRTLVLSNDPTFLARVDEVL